MKSIVLSIIIILLAIVSNLTAAITQVGQYNVGAGGGVNEDQPDTSSMEVFVLGDYAYVPSIEGLATFDISDPTSIIQIDWENAPSPNWSTISYQDDGFLYLTCTTGGFHTISLADPTAPLYLQTIDDNGGANNATIYGDYAYIAYGNNGIHVISMNAARTTLTLDYECPARGVTPIGVDNDGTYVYLACGNDGIVIRTIASLLASTNVVTGDLDFGAQVAENIRVVGDWAFVCCGSDGIKVVDVSDRAAPVLHATAATTDAVFCDVFGDYLYVADGAGGLRIYDISVLPLGVEPPYVLNQTDVYDPNGNPAETYRGAFASNGYVYIGDQLEGLRILEATDYPSDMQSSFTRNTWEMIGVPTTVTSGDAVTLFGDDFLNAAVGSPRWRMSQWDDANQKYVRYGELDNPDVGGNDEPTAIAPGQGYWLVQNVVDNCVLDVTAAQNSGIVSQGARYSITLNTETRAVSKTLTQVANPFHYPFDLTNTWFSINAGGDITAAAAATASYINGNAYTWDVATQEYVTIAYNASIGAWTGFWVIQTDDDVSIDIKFNPDGFGGAPPRPEDGEGDNPEDTENWTLDLSVVSTDGIYRDTYNKVGSGAQYNDEYDSHDAFELTPMASRFVQLYFPHPDWELLPDDYTFDFRSENVADGETWEFSIETYRLPDHEFELSWTNMESVPAGVTFSLEDISNQIGIVNLGGEASYRFTGSQEERGIVNFELTLHRSNAVEDESLPSEFELLTAHPNPFNNSTKIFYTVPSAQDVSLELFDLMGRRITTLTEGHHEAGSYSHVWDAGNQASGSYIVKLRYAGEEKTSKITLIR